MGFISQIFNSPKALAKLVSAGVSAGDALVYTKEEKARYSQEMAKLSIDYLKASSGQNIVRRMLALGIGAIWSFCFLTHIGLLLASVFVHGDKALQLKTAAAMLQESLTDLSGLVLAILAFYFYLPHSGQLWQKLGDKWGERKNSKLGAMLLDREQRRLLAQTDEQGKELFSPQVPGTLVPVTPNPEKPLGLDASVKSPGGEGAELESKQEMNQYEDSFFSQFQQQENPAAKTLSDAKPR